MKRAFFSLLVTTILGPVAAQTVHGIEPDTTVLNLITEVKTMSGTSAEQTERSGTGQLGISFRKEYFYGAVLFNVVNKNSSLTSIDSSEVNLFANNLLIPENSGQGISNFRIGFGVRSFGKLDTDWSKENLISWRRLGVYGWWNVNNTVWTKDSVTSPLTISSFGLNATYSLLSLQVFNARKDNVHLALWAGWEARRLGGDYALPKNEDVRRHFLGTTNYAFNSVLLGVQLEVGDFFGRVQHYNFGTEDQIDGFSGYQAVVTVGLNVEFNVKAEGIAPNNRIKAVAVGKKEAKEARMESKKNRKLKKESDKAKKAAGK